MIATKNLRETHKSRDTREVQDKIQLARRSEVRHCCILWNLAMASLHFLSGLLVYLDESGHYGNFTILDSFDGLWPKKHWDYPGSIAT